MRIRKGLTIIAARIGSATVLIVAATAFVGVGLCRGEVLLERQLFDLQNIDAIAVECETGEGLEHVSEVSAVEFSIIYEGYIPAMQPEVHGSRLQGARLYVFTYSNCHEFYDGIGATAFLSPDSMSSGLIVLPQSLDASGFYIDQDEPWSVTIYLETDCDCMLERETHFDNLRIALRVFGAYDSTDNRGTSFSYIKTLYR